MTKKRWKISYNSPVILSFSILCLLVLVLAFFTNDWTTNLLFSVYRSPLSSPLTYVRFFGHVLGHADWGHLIGNITLILVVGPLLEEKYGSYNILFVILATAFITGMVNFIFFPHIRLQGASGVVYALILLSSYTSIKDGSVPLTLILVALIYIGGEVYAGIAVKDNISNLTHMLGGVVGASLGYILNKHKLNSY